MNTSPIKALQAFVGKWNTTGQSAATFSGEAFTVEGTDAYEWMSGGYLLLHTVEVIMNNEKVHMHEIISYNTSTGNYQMHAFDNQGNVSMMTARLENDTWIFEGPAERGRFTFSDNGNRLSGQWEGSPDGQNWHPWMQVQLTKAI